MTAITHFILTRLRSDQSRVDIFDNTSYATRQVYVDNALVIETTSFSFVAQIKANQKVDILGLSSGEAGTDFSSSLSDDNGDKIEFALPITYSGLTVRIYGDIDTTEIDFGTPVGSGTVGDNVVRTGLNLGDLTLNGYGDIDLDGYGSLLLTGDNGEPYVRLFITKRLANGTYRFAVVNYNQADNEHRPLYLSKTITTRPDELAPYIVDYNSVTDQMVVSAGTNETTGVYSLYTADWGVGATGINFSTPFFTSTHSPFIVSGFRGVNNSGSRIFVVRKTVSGVEDQSTVVLTFTVLGGNWTGNIPSAPAHLTGTILAGNKVRLKWQYQPTSQVPTGFKVYSGVGAIAYDTADATVPYVGEGIITVDLDAITEATRFSVRAYQGGVDDGNVEYVTMTPLDVPVIVSATGVETWKET